MAMLPKGTLGLCCFHIAQLMAHLPHFNNTINFTDMYTAEGNKESKGM